MREQQLVHFAFGGNNPKQSHTHAPSCSHTPHTVRPRRVRHETPCAPSGPPTGIKINRRRCTMEKERGKHRAGQSSKGPPHACVCTAAAASSLAASSTAARGTLIAHLALSLSSRSTQSPRYSSLPACGYIGSK